MSQAGSDRAVSDLVGYVLMVGVILVGVGLTAGLGVDHLERAQLTQNSNSVEQAMELLEDDLEELQQSRSTVRTTTMSLNRGQVRIAAGSAPSSVAVNVTGTGATNETLEVDMGAIAYELEDSVVAYESGGVYLDTFQGNALVRAEPSFVCDGERAIVSVVTLQGPAAGGSYGGANADIVARTNESRVLFPRNRSGVDSVAESTGVNVTVDSAYEGAWRAALLDGDQDWTQSGTNPARYRCEPDSGPTMPVYVRQTVVDMSVQR